MDNFLNSKCYDSVSFKDLGIELTASMRDPFSDMNPWQVEGSRDGMVVRPMKNFLPTQKKESVQPNPTQIDIYILKVKQSHKIREYFFFA